MQLYSDREPSVEEQVTTEPQRLALETMSNELVEKLHAMVEEQQQRAREFAAHQHSLSSLPSTHTPAVAPPPAPPAPYIPEEYDYTPQEEVYTNLPPIPKRPTPPRAAYTEQPVAHHAPKPRKPAKVQQEDTEGNIGAGTIIFILAVLFIILSKGCS